MSGPADTRPSRQPTAKAPESRASAGTTPPYEGAPQLAAHGGRLAARERAILDVPMAVEASRDRYADLFDFAPIPYVVVDGAGTIRDLNLRGATLLGRERARAVGWPLVDYVTAADRRTFLDHVRRSRRGDGLVRSELALEVAPGDHVPVELLTRRQIALGGDLYLTAIVDLSERQRAEIERAAAHAECERLLRREQALQATSAAKDRFLAVLGHELRNPLTPILLVLELLRRRDVPAALAEPIETIRRNAALASRLIDDLLDLARIAEGKLRLALEPTDVHALVHDAVAMERPELDNARIETRFDLRAVHAWVRADPARLRQVLCNLLRNAVRHSPDGTLTLTTTTAGPDTLRLAVRDTGIGLEPAELERIFDLFEQRRDRAPVGLGIGLAVCRQIVEAHGGRIAAHSRGRGKGSTFEITLPLAARAAAPEPARAEAPSASRRQTLRILLVEDDPDCAAALAESLELEGYAVRVARSIAEAVALAAEGLDLLVSDLGLPDGDGRELLRRLDLGTPPRAIALSGYGTEDEIARSRAAGFARHLVKPIMPAALVAAIEDVSVPSRTSLPDGT